MEYVRRMWEAQKRIFYRFSTVGATVEPVGGNVIE